MLHWPATCKMASALDAVSRDALFGSNIVLVVTGFASLLLCLLASAAHSFICFWLSRRPGRPDGEEVQGVSRAVRFVRLICGEGCVRSCNQRVSAAFGTSLAQSTSCVLLLLAVSLTCTTVICGVEAGRMRSDADNTWQLQFASYLTGTCHSPARVLWCRHAGGVVASLRLRKELNGGLTSGMRDYWY